MANFGETVWGGFGGSSPATVGTPLSTLLMAMLRIAGITTLPGTTPNVDQYGELIPMVNRMLSSWNCDGHKIFTTQISDPPFLLNANQKVYTIGPGADLDMDRPVSIKYAVILFPTSPIYRRRMRILSDDEWSQIGIQEITGAPPFSLYYDGGMDDNGWGKVYVYFQPPDGYSLELYTWQQLKTSFTDPTDQAIFPPGYEQAITWNGGVQIAGMYPLEAKLSAVAPAMASNSLQTLITLNSQCPALSNEAAQINRRTSPRSSMTPYAWWLYP